MIISKFAASFENDLSQLWLFQKTAASFENGLSQFWLFQKTVASVENGMTQSVLSEYPKTNPIENFHFSVSVFEGIRFWVL